MKYKFTPLILLAALLGLGLQVALAAPRLINYQGILQDNMGDPINGNYDVSLEIFPGPVPTGLPLWAEEHPDVLFTDGLFNVILGSVNPIDDSLFATSDERWLAVAFGGGSPTQPFTRITSVPWALRAAIADSAVNFPGGQGGSDGDWTIAGNNMSSAVSGAVGIGTTSPDGKLHVVNGSMAATVADHDYDLIQDSWSAVDGRYGTNAAGFLGRRVFVLNNDYYYGVYGETETAHQAVGVMGLHKPTGNYGFLGVDDFGAYGRYADNGNYGFLGAEDHGVFGMNRQSGFGSYSGVRGENETSGNYGYLGGDDLGAYAFHGGTANNVHLAGANYALKATALNGNAAEFAGNVYVTNGRVTVPEIEITGGADLSERFAITGELLPGYVVSIDPNQPGQLAVSDEAYDRKVAGIISGAGGVKPGLLMGQDATCATGSEAVALSGRVYCWVDATEHPARPGDLLTTSSRPGHAMKVVDHDRAQGAIIGKAMTGLESGQGLVLVLVRPQ
jgi:hypothetical protein